MAPPGSSRLILASPGSLRFFLTSQALGPVNSSSLPALTLALPWPWTCRWPCLCVLLTRFLRRQVQIEDCLSLRVSQCQHRFQCVIPTSLGCAAVLNMGPQDRCGTSHLITLLSLNLDSFISFLRARSSQGGLREDQGDPGERGKPGGPRGALGIPSMA